MARLARVVLPNYPHHITQRGNRRQDVFFHAEDYAKYLDLISQWCREEGIAIWSYCLMTNHVHLIVTPEEGADLSRAIDEGHRRYTRYTNFREGWRGYLWQGRFASFPMDEPYLLSAAAHANRFGLGWSRPRGITRGAVCMPILLEKVTVMSRLGHY